ncbi:MAG: hypothetical protein JXB14_03350 [Candidatus Altiarchaeota archaeon]|nr:hypothetical protein [Candidatus Altiarchaeota archaeon]
MRKTILILLSTIALLGVVGAEEIVYYNMDLELTRGGALRENIEFKIVNLESSKLKLPVPFEPKNLTVGGGLGFEVEEGEGYVISIMTGGQRNLEVSLGFFMEGYVQKLEGKYLFAFAHIPSLGTNNFTVRLGLPMGSGISSNDPRIPSVSPPPRSIFTDGRRIVLEWEYGGLRPNEAINFVVVYEFGIGLDGDGSGFSLLLPYLMVFAMGVLLSLFIYWFLLRPRLERIEVVKEVLGEDENRIVKAMEGADRIKQEDLRGGLGYSKAKISKIVSGLEKKGVLEKERYGRTNILRLKK